MNEQEQAERDEKLYIVASDLAKVRMAKYALAQTSEGGTLDYKLAYRALDRIEEKLKAQWDELVGEA